MNSVWSMQETKVEIGKMKLCINTFAVRKKVKTCANRRARRASEI
jgi:hypothetical protein